MLQQQVKDKVPTVCAQENVLFGTRRFEKRDKTKKSTSEEEDRASAAAVGHEPSPEITCTTKKNTREVHKRATRKLNL